MDFLHLPKRQEKPRYKGITATIDLGISIAELEGILNDYSNFLDIVKLGVATAYITPNLEEKIALYRKYQIEVYFGGTLFEKCYSQNRLDEYTNWLKQLGISTIEISVGCLDIGLPTRLKLVEKLAKEFKVISEVGSKNSKKIIINSDWINEIRSFHEAGCYFVITEGRDSATAGIYHSNEEIYTELINDILQFNQVEKIIFEAPTPKTQMLFINLVGVNVNIGNVSMHDLLLLEAQRRGLRYETFNIKDFQ